VILKGENSNHAKSLRGPASALALAVAAGLLTASLAGAAVDSPFIPKSPKFVAPVTKAPPKGTRMHVVADQFTYNSKTKIATATGTVRMVYGPYILTATHVSYDFNKDVFKANGSVVLREPNGNVMEANSAQLTNHFKQGFAEHVKALLTNNVTITADYAKKIQDGISIYTNMTYTACKDCVRADGTPAWQIKAPQATHDQNTKTIHYVDPTFELAGMPVFWLPYLSYPDPTVKRRSGFLLPNFGYSKVYGAGVTVPYFWDVAPNMDVTFRPMITSKQGLFGDAEWRHRLASGEYNIRGYGIYQLDPGAARDASRWRGAITSKGDFKIDDTWSWGWDGTLLSDINFYRDYGISNPDMITNNVHVTDIDDRAYVSAQILNYQSLRARDDAHLIPYAVPHVTASDTLAQSVLGGEVGFNVDAYSLYRDDAATAFDLGTQQTRAVASLDWQRRMVNGWGQVITPFASVRADIYDAKDVPGASSEDVTTARVLPTAGLDVRWPFIASQTLGQSILTPVAQIIASPGEKDSSDIAPEDAITMNFDHTNLFLQDRFSGLDRYEGGTRANAGLMYTFLAQNGGFLRASAGESYHIAGTNSFTAGSGLEDDLSDIVGAVAFQPNDKLRFTYEARAAQDFSSMHSQETSVSLTLDRISGSLSYADVDKAPDYGRPENARQIWADAGYQFADAWKMFGGFRYDLGKDKFMDRYLGLMFDCDCMRAKLVYEDSIDDETLETGHSLKLSVEFRTIGVLGGKIKF